MLFFVSQFPFLMEREAEPWNRFTTWNPDESGEKDIMHHRRLHLCTEALNKMPSNELRIAEPLVHYRMSVHRSVQRHVPFQGKALIVLTGPDNSARRA
jgi:hypothetical protein